MAAPAPAVTRYRRPFLAPVWLTMLAALCVFIALGVAVALYRSASTTLVVLVRPAEKEAGTIDDPPLSPEGEERAQMLAQMLGETTGVGRLDAIFVSDSRRAQQIMMPLAERLGKRPVVVPNGDIGSMASRITRGHEGGTVLFVGNGSNIPQLVQELTGIEVGPSSDTEHDSLYVVSIPTLGRANVLRIRY
jgi:phosphohistidine phosphatase SixA